VNTRDRRASALGCGLAFLVSLPLPDGAALDQGDRQHAVALYRGILADSPAVATPINLCDAENTNLAPALHSVSLVPELESVSLVPDLRNRTICP
jgi:hypothetical protein